jgi:hypothetical protein
MKMRYLYGFLKLTLPYSLHVFFKKIKVINAPKETLGRTFFASNHPSSFMDPLLPGALCKPIIHFMARADVHKGIMKHLYYHAHMIPIFRQQDGSDNQEKNEEIFKIVAKEVRAGKSILVYPEGFTDDVFIRHLKPLKKGIARMAFFTLEQLNWEEKVYLQALGTNYSNPGVFRSELILKYGKKICLNDFKDLYKENPNKAIHAVMAILKEEMTAQITYVENLENCELHENIMRLTRRGMNHENSDFSIPLEMRFYYSQDLAAWLNAQDERTIENLRQPVNDYFRSLQATKLKEEDVYEFSRTGKLNISKHWIYNILLIPLALLGLLHGWISWFILKPKIEKAFKRSVFWSSVKMVTSIFISGFYNVLLLIPFYFFVFPSVLGGLLYLILFVGPSFIVFHRWIKNTGEIKRKSTISLELLMEFAEKRSKVLAIMNEILPENLR